MKQKGTFKTWMTLIRGKGRFNMKISRKQALKLIEGHNFQPDQQTASIKGELVKEGTSFNEMLGIKENYESKLIFAWLGY